MEWTRALRVGCFGRTASSTSDCVVFGAPRLSASGLAEELGDHGVAEAFDVHDAARGEVEELFVEAGGAAGVDAAPVDFAFGADEFAAGSAGSAWGRRFPACRAGVLASSTTSVILGMTSPPRSTETKSPMRTPRRAISSGLWSVARVTVVPPMKTGASAATGVTLPVRPTWKRTSFELRDAGARGELVGDGPARGLAGEAEAALLGDGVDLDDDAVDLVAEGVAEGLGFGDEGEDLVDGRRRCGRAG